MKSRKKTKYAHVGRYVVELDVELIEDETDWAPYLSLDDVRGARSPTSFGLQM